MCELLEVSRSGFYEWRKSRAGGPTLAQRRRAGLDAKVAEFHAASDGVYGAPRICADLHADGERVSRKTVAASLRRQGLAGISPRRFAPATTAVDLDAAVPEDLVRRRLSVHLGAARAVRARAQPGPLRWPHGGVLGQRSGRIILGHTKNRVLRQISMAY
jgi:hypothetical protein